jgi:hypothetical protein
LNDGGSEGEHLGAAAQTLRKIGRGDKAKAIEEDGAPPFPFELEYLWVIFHDVSMGLAVTGMAIPTITWESLQAYEQLNGAPLEAWERRALMQLSSARAHVLSIRPAEQKDTPANGRKLPRRPNR